MKEVEVYGSVTTEDGEFIKVVSTDGNDITDLFRDDMIKIAYENGEALKYNEETGRAKRIDPDQLPNPTPKKKEVVKDEDPVLAFINNAPSIKPDHLEITDIKWKYLIRSAVRGKNIMMVGPAGSGKTEAAKALPTATDRPFFYFNLGATQDPRSTHIGNTHFKNNETLFDESAFIKAIKTENAVILLDELSRAHPEAWNILMTVLDEGQRYLRLDENIDAPLVNVASGVSFIATANIGTEYTSTRVLDRALMDRFEVIEVDILSKEREHVLLGKRFGDKVEDSLLESVADIADVTRKEWRSDEGKLSTMISTRMTVRICELLADGFTLEEAAEVGILPFFDASGGGDSERLFVKQVIQKHLGTADEDIFNIEEEEEQEQF
jgi:nitric oxide reductase NorQ protein